MNVQKNGVPLKHISRGSLERKFRKVFRDKMDSIAEQLKDATHVCTTADIWTANCRRFLGVTVHRIDPKSFKRHSAAIVCRRFERSHTHDRIASLLEEIHASFGLDSQKIVATVTDNASNFKKAYEEFGVDVTYTDGIEGTSEQESNTESDTEIVRDPHDISSEKENAFPVDSGADIGTLSGLPRLFKCASHTLNLLATTDVLRTI